MELVSVPILVHGWAVMEKRPCYLRQCVNVYATWGIGRWPGPHDAFSRRVYSFLRDSLLYWRCRLTPLDTNQWVVLAVVRDLEPLLVQWCIDPALLQVRLRVRVHVGVH